MKKQYAFWGYDQYPYTLGGEITRFHDAKKGQYLHGCVETKNFGAGYWFEPFMILDGIEGENLLLKLKSLESQYKDRQLQVELLSDLLLKGAIPTHPKFNKTKK